VTRASAVVGLVGCLVIRLRGANGGAKELIAVQPAHITQDDDLLRIAAKARGLADEDGGYLWRGELRLWDNELLMGWYAASDGAVRSKGTMYFALHPHGGQAQGRWVGMSYDGKVITGWATMGRNGDEPARLIEELKQTNAQGLTP
jgi:hypothetical protein